MIADGRLVNIHSGTMNHKGVREVGEIARAELDALGFDTGWSDMSSATTPARGDPPQRIALSTIDE